MREDLTGQPISMFDFFPVGAGIAADWRPRPGFGVDARLAVESGSDWTEHELGVGANLFF